jgi:hypothetical protein
LPGRAQSRAARFARRSCDQREHPRRRTFHGEIIVGTVGRVTRTDRLSAVPKIRVTASSHRPAGSGTVARRRPAAPGGLPPKGRGFCRRHGRGPSPAHFPLRPWWSFTRHVSRFPFFCTPRLQFSIYARAEARRWRAEGASLKPQRKLSRYRQHRQHRQHRPDSLNRSSETVPQTVPFPTSGHW